MLKTVLKVQIILALVFMFSCDSKKETREGNVKNKVMREGLVQQRHADGTLAAEINYKGQKKNGLAKYYYKNGKLRSEVYFKDDIKHGEASFYYENGQLFQLTNYINGKKDGIQRKYRDDGLLMAEVPYKMDQPGIGLVEYTLKGKVKTNYPKLLVETIDDVIKNSQYIVRAHFSERMSDIMFYVGDLAADKYLHSDLMKIAPKEGGVLELKYFVPPGTFLMEKINIIGVGKTRLKNPLIIQQEVNLAAENRGY